MRDIELMFMEKASIQFAGESPILTCTTVFAVGVGVGFELVVFVLPAPPPQPETTTVIIAAKTAAVIPSALVKENL
jgi:hypothetical protein